VLLASGCYESHLRDEPLGPSPCPDEPERPAGSRPSDGPDADAWLDPPVIAGPCCTVSGAIEEDLPGEDDRVLLAAVDGRAAAVWSSGFGILGASGEWVEAPRAHEPGATSVAAGCGQIAVTRFLPSRRAPEAPVRLQLLDLRGEPVAESVLEDPSFGGVVLRHGALHRWATVTIRPIDERTASLRLRLADSEAAIDDEVSLGRIDDLGRAAAGAASVGDRLVLFESDAEGVRARSFAGRTLREGPGDRMEFVSGVFAAEGMAVAGLRDTAIVVVYAAGVHRAGVFDPYAARFVAGPVDVVRVGTRGTVASIAAEERGGTVGVCYRHASDSGDPDRFSIGIVGPDGSPIGEPVLLRDGDGGYAAACSIAAVGLDTFVVAWWWYGEPGAVGHAVVRVRRAP
jgi:hypothetical protein